VVIDSADIRDNPEKAVTALCAALGLNFEPAMLGWPRGGIAQDGVWATHWYGAVHNSTGFAGPEGALPELDDDMRPVLERALPIYLELERRKLRF
jgi:hypothetical protein